MSRVLIAFSLLFAFVVAVGAEQPVPDPQLRARLGALRTGGNPYGQLFAAQDLAKPSPKPSAVEMSKPTVVCGMTIIPADPKADPKMKLEPKKTDGMKYTIRAIDPPICNPAR